MTRARILARGLFSLAALIALVAAIPWALARWGRLPGTPNGDWWSRLPDSTVSDNTVFVVLTVAAWGAWAIFATAVVIETMAGLRGIQAPRLGIAGPLQRSARRLVVGVLLLASLTNHQPAFAAGAHSHAPTLPSRAAATSLVVDVPTTVAAPTDESAALHSAEPLAEDPTDTTARDDAGVAVIVVRHGDTPWELAETHLGDGFRWKDLWDINRGVPQPDGRSWTDPQLVVTGWQLRLPGDATIPPAPTATVAPGSTITHVVEDGDTLSGLAGRYLGDPARYPEIYAANTDRIQPDGRHLTDPSLIVVGWQLTIPTGATPAIAPTPSDPLPAAGPSPSAPADPTPASASAPADLPPPSTSTFPAPTGDDALPAPSTTLPKGTADGPAATTAAPVADHGADEIADGSVVPIVAGIGGAVVLATGLAAQLRWLRRRRATRGARHAAQAPGPVEVAALTAADVPLVRWAGQRIATLIPRLDRRRLTASPLAIELSEVAGIELLWDAPQQAAPTDGWTAADGGWAWRLGFDPDEEVPPDDLPAAIPAVVTIGERDGRQLLIDLEAVGTLAVLGPAENTAAFARSVALELACGNDLADAYVLTVGLDLPEAIVPPYRLTAVDSTAAALNLLAQARTSIDASLAHDGAPDTFRARAASSPPIEATVVVANGAALDDLSGTAPPRRGVAVVATGDQSTAGARLIIDPTGATARLEPLGIELTPVGVPARTTTRLTAEVEVLAALPEFADPLTPSCADLAGNGHHPTDTPERPATADAASNAGMLTDGASADGRGEENGHRTGVVPLGDDASMGDRGNGDGHLFDLASVGDGPSNDGRLLVRVLGVPRIDERPDVGRREVILTALLACRGGTLASSAVQDALWGGKPIEAKTMWNFVAATRRALGTFADGSAVMPAADRSRGKLRLDPRVTTDLALLRDTVTRADELSSSEAIAGLHEALALVDGPPFDAPGCDWAHRDQDVADATTLVERAVEQLVTLTLEAGHLDIARDAISRGLRGLPGDEVLYRLRMRVETAAGNHAGIVAAYDELCVYLADLETQPSPTTTALYNELVRRPATGRLT